jgi:hypothetical protein
MNGLRHLPYFSEISRDYYPESEHEESDLKTPLNWMANLPVSFEREDYSCTTECTSLAQHGTNLWVVIMAVQLSGHHLLAGEEQFKVSPFATATGESKGNTPLNSKYVSTVEISSEGNSTQQWSYDALEYGKMAASLSSHGDFRLKACNLEARTNVYRVNNPYLKDGLGFLEHDFYKSVYGPLSKIPAIISGHPCGGTKGVVWSKISGELGCQRVLIKKVGVGLKYVEHVKNILSELGAEDIVVEAVGAYDRERPASEEKI